MTSRPSALHVGPVITVPDLDRARAFYEGILGLDGGPTPGGWRLRGVAFLDRTQVPFDLDEDGISVTADLQVAWLKDPDGSVLTLFSTAG